MRRAVVPLVLLAALAAVGTATWLVVRDAEPDPAAPAAREAPAPERVVTDAPRRTARQRVRTPTSYCEVRAEDGGPAVGATVVVVDPHGPSEHLTTDAEGRAPWDPPEGASVFAVAPGLACSRDVAVAGEERIVVRLGVGAGIDGTVRWVDGTPAADVVVELAIWRSGYTTQWAARTDRAGRYAFRGVPPEARVRPQVRQTRDVVPTGDAETITAPAWAETASVDLSVRRPDRAEVHVDLVFPEDAELPEYGRVQASDADGANLVEARIACRPREHRAFGMVAVGRTTILRITAGGFVGETAPFVPGDGERIELTVVMRSAARLRLRAVDPEGRPVARPDLVAHLLLQRGDAIDPLRGRGFQGDAVVDVTDLLPTDEALGAPGARLHVILDGPGIARGGMRSARGPNLTVEGFDLLRRLQSGGDVTLDVRLHAPTRVTIVTVDADGNVAPDVTLALRPANAFLPVQVRTDETGRAEVDVLLDTGDDPLSRWGRVEIEAQDPYRGTLRPEAPSRPDATPTWTVRVQRLRLVRVRVVDPSGAAVAGGSLETGYTRRWDVAEDGTAEIRTLPSEAVRYEGETHVSPLLPAPAADEMVLVAYPRAAVLLDVVLDAEELAAGDVEATVGVTTVGGYLVSRQTLTDPTTRIRIPLRNASREETVRVEVRTGTGLRGTVEMLPDDTPVRIELERKPEEEDAE